jgi:hypothetical protein
LKPIEKYQNLFFQTESNENGEMLGFAINSRINTSLLGM